MRGQEEAPIELLIGVTMLAFVLVVAMLAYSNLSSSQYEQKLKASVSKLARTIESVYMGSVGSSLVTDVDFSAPSQSTSKVKDIRILRGSSDLCYARFGRSDCLVIIATVEDKGRVTGQLVVEPVNVPGSVRVFNELQGASCDLSSINYDQWSSSGEDYFDCWLKKRYYSLRVTKETNEKIVISSP